MSEAQCTLRKGNGCVDQVFAVKQVIGKYCETNKCVNIAFTDLKKVIHRVNIKTMWQVLLMYAGNGVLVCAGKSLTRRAM